MGVALGADHRHYAVEQEAQARFSGTTLTEFHRWGDADLLTEAVFDASSVLADGARYGEASVEVRYPASFLGLQRCVFVALTTTDAQLRGGTGQECSQSIG